MIAVNLQKARTIAHQLRRAARDAEMAPLDDAIAKAIPGRADQAEAARAKVRAKYDQVQADIDVAADLTQLGAIVAGLSNPVDPSGAVP